MILKNTDIRDLLNKVRDNKLKLVCFGAGEQLRDACKYFADYGFHEYIHKIIDNNPKLFMFNDFSMQCQLPETVLEDVDKLIVYIASKSYPEMYEQLNLYSELLKVECYIHTYVIHKPMSYTIPTSNRNAVPSIPKIIHYCWFGGKEIPSKNRKWMESWKLYCPEYEIIQWDESNYDVNKNQYMSDAYKENKWAFVSDYARLDIIYEYGGVYLDVDVELCKSLDPLLQNEAFCGFSSIEHVGTGLGFGALKYFPLVKIFRDYYDNISFYMADGSLNLNDNGVHQTAVLNKFGLKHNHTVQEICNMRIYPVDVLSPVDAYCNPVAFTSNTFAVHHYDATWFDEIDHAKRGIDLHIYRDFWDTYAKHLEVSNE